MRSSLFGGGSLGLSRTASPCAISRDHTPKPGMGRAGIRRRTSTRAGAITLTIGGVTKEGSPFDYALGRVRIAWIITFSRSTRLATHVLVCGLKVGIDPVPIAAP